VPSHKKWNFSNTIEIDYIMKEIVFAGCRLQVACDYLPEPPKRSKRNGCFFSATAELVPALLLFDKVESMMQ
jgi:hypothetical protein